MKKKKTILLPDNLSKPGEKKAKALIPASEITNSISSIEVVKERIDLVNRLYKEILEKDKHFGKLPGTDKDTLFKPGAEKLNVLFKLVPKVENEEIIELGQNHREYRLMIGLYHKETGQFFGDCVGSCSTMEGKYRYRYKSENTNIAVDKEYWSYRDQYILDDYFKKYPKKKGLKTEKIDGRWYFVKKEKAENPDIADVYNTVYKMAYKRAFVGATIIATGVSDIFTQDLDDNLEPEKNNHKNGNKQNLFTQENNNFDSQNNEKSNNINSDFQHYKKEIEKVLECASKYLSEKNKRIEELESIPTKTVKEFIKIPCDKKDEEYAKLDTKCKGYKEELKTATTTIENQNIALIKALELSKEMDFALSPYVMFGIGNIKDYIINQEDMLDFNLTIGLDYIKYLFKNRLGIIIGGYVTPVQDVEVGAKFGLLITFKKKK